MSIDRALPFVVPERKYTHKYVENFIITSGVAGVFGTSYDYAANGMYDPYLGVGGHQPYGFDELSPWYNSFTVIAVDVAVSCVAPSNGTTALGVAWRPSAGSFAIAGLGISDFCEKDNTRLIYIPPSPANARDVTTSLGRFSIARLEGRTEQQILTEGNYTGTSAGNPASVPRLMFATCDLSGASSATCALIIELTYHAVWRGPKTFGQS